MKPGILLCAACLIAFQGWTQAKTQIQRTKRQTKFDKDNDNWGAWSEGSSCSRSCGGGVYYQTRKCNKIDQDGSHSCLGPEKIYRSCNIQDCPEDSKDFRLVQCERYNNISFDGEYYQWVPYYGAPNKCELNCLARGEKFYYRHAAKVMDGTRCEPKSSESLDVCVNGVCKHVGCDLMLGSSAKLDKCLECGGNATSCRTVKGSINIASYKSGYNDVLLIPAGATTIHIAESQASYSFLALRSTSGKYYLNGDWKIHPPHKMLVAGSTFHYKRQNHPSLGPESIIATGPTDQALVLVLISQPGASFPITYEYSIPNTVKVGKSGTYQWATGPWQACSASCSGGVQMRNVTCVKGESGETVADALCDPVTKPIISQTCNRVPCDATWYVGFWEPCSTSCGKGIQLRTVFCHRLFEGDMYVVVSDSECKEKKPQTMQTCNDKVQCPKWEVGSWSMCNRVCGPGFKQRQVICKAQHTIPNALSDILPDGRCGSDGKPSNTEECNAGPCEGLEWVVSEWSKCIGNCGSGYETRQVVCSSRNGKIHSDEHCDTGRKPETTRPCTQDQTCLKRPQWHYSQWSSCSAQCGVGVQVRQIICGLVEHNQINRAPEADCDPAAKMVGEQNCTGTACTGMWFKGPWGKCSVPCGGGQKKREVLCFSDGNVVGPDECDINGKPEAIQDCNSDKCDDDDLILIGGCKATQYGCCPDGISKAEGPGNKGCPSGDSVPRGACIESDFGCCRDGLTAAQGPFKQGCPQYTCKSTKHGCCPDKQTPAAGPNEEGCPVGYGCESTAYGCCPDKVTAANGPKHQGCKAQEPKCRNTNFGCCPDNVTEATGPNNEGCEEGSGELCEDSVFGCCDDKVTAATGPNKEGCNEIPSSCTDSEHGCCPDGTAARGPNMEGCDGVEVKPKGCDKSLHGCCPDGVTSAQGPNEEGCDKKVPVDCSSSKFGCCPDGKTIALGPENKGCPDTKNCITSQFGCCPDGKTAAKGENYDGCDGVVKHRSCENTQFGCCPNSDKAATGSNYAGCNITQKAVQCDMTTYGCCLDGRNVASGPEFQGCAEIGTYVVSCRDDPYGCCDDGTTAAKGPNGAGCPSLLEGLATCSLTKATGTCRNYAVKWYFDKGYGDCRRFWYGGCDGNTNRFDTKEECKRTCVTPKGLGKCYLPKTVGPCRSTKTLYYYNSDSKACEQLLYGGCLGNDNRFKTLKECADECVVPQRPDICSQPYKPGPCRGEFRRWFFDKKSGVCRQFMYGGCYGNDNRFTTEEECNQRCKAGSQVCKLPRQVGPCEAALRKWFFDIGSRQCREFIYGGCQGNGNRFSSKEECEARCDDLLPKKTVDICTLAKDTGRCRSYMRRWYYDKNDGYCKQFVYGGCEGNDNRFETEQKCRQACNAKPPIDVCTLAKEVGPCTEAHNRYYLDRRAGQCLPFVYGGCSGNGNNFQTLEECKKTCSKYITQVKPGKQRCALPRDSGTCLGRLERWYYDYSIKQCRRFLYGSCGGNENRFLTQQECEAECQGMVVTLPPPTSTAAPTSASTVPSTSTRVVVVTTPTVKPVVTCSLPRNPGPCLAYIPSWYFDSSEQRCKEFVYGGCQGNANRFASREDCEHHCPITDICTLAPEAGECLAYMPRWYFDKNSKRCQQFVYGGCKGNANRFNTQEDCESRCGSGTPEVPKVTGLAICALPVKSGSRCLASKRRWHYSIEEGVCKEFVYSGCDGNENNFRTREECITACPFTGICQQPQDKGRCRAAMPRFFYDSETGQCRRFIYGGCRGNANRFLQLENCERICAFRMRQLYTSTRASTVTTSARTPSRRITTGRTTTAGGVCRLAGDPGQCWGEIPMWYYNGTEGLCQPFIYTGCHGNANRFLTQAECEDECQQWYNIPIETATESEHTAITVAKPAFCLLPWQSGPCAAYVPAWYYDPKLGRCMLFVYGGCLGNKNRFVTREECQRRCAMQASGGVTTSASSVTEDRFLTSGDIRSAGISLASTASVTNKGDVAHITVPPDHIITTPDHITITRDYIAEDITEDTTEDGIAVGGDSITAEVSTHTRPTIETPGICKQGKDPGPCTNYAPVWYFEPVTRTCRRFLYGGCDGNGNRFQNRQQCEQACLYGTPAATSPLTTQPTQPTKPTRPRVTPQTSPRQTFTSPTISTSTMESIEFDVCAERPNPGPCRDYTIKWYYDAQTGTCNRFRYGGCDGNANRFNTQGECTLTCIARRSKVAGLCVLDVDPGPCNAQKRRWYYNAANGTCQLFMYGGCLGNDNRFYTESTCLKTCSHRTGDKVKPKGAQGFCDLPAETGPCKASVQRWFYDPKDDTCKDFIYGGCQGNLNNFASKQKCLSSCKLGSTTGVYDHCLLKKDTGPCRANMARWYYNKAEGRCERFRYGGCKGNGNRFLSEKECQNTCKDVGQGKIPKGREVCVLPKKTGPCYADFMRFYYDTKVDECRPFVFGGCQGNGNNFRTQDECYKGCGNGTKAYEIKKPGDCFQPSLQGTCQQNRPMWYFDASRGDCAAFYYGGCEGNGNRFHSYEDCMAFCSKVTVQCGVLECDKDKKCPFGLKKGPDGCTLCECYNPCENQRCPHNQACVVEQIVCVTDPCPGPRPVCKPKPKEGTCPVFKAEDKDGEKDKESCRAECRADIDCDGIKKCCQKGCHRVCVEPYVPEEAPKILPDIDPQVVTAVGSTLKLPCRVKGAPKPQTTWYRNRIPLVREKEKYPHVTMELDGSLHIRPVSKTDAASYTCRAYNGVGQPAIRTYFVTVKVPASIAPGPTKVAVVAGRTLQLECRTKGEPRPTVRWFHGRKPLPVKSVRITQDQQGTLMIRKTQLQDAGQYICEANNGLAQPQRRTVTVKVLGPLRVTIAEHNGTYGVGDDVRLVCIVQGDTEGTNFKVNWTRNDGPIPATDRFRQTAVGELLIEDTTKGDSANYTCVATRDDEKFSVSTEVEISEASLPAGCVDKPYYANCRLIIAARLCRHNYFSDFCCESCYRAGQLP